jgi:hypothetical protein
MTPEEIIREVDKLTRSLDTKTGFWKRIRIAISPEEETALKQFVYDYESKHLRTPVYFRRIRAIPVLVESNPDDLELTVEYPLG